MNALTHPMGPPSGRIYDTWTSEDFVRLNRLNMKRKLVALAMVRHGDRQDARVMLSREASNRSFSGCYERPGQWVQRRAVNEVRATLQVVG